MDLAVLVGAAAIVAAITVGVWRVLRGPPLWQRLRVITASAVAVVVTAVVGWRISKAAAFQLLDDPIVRVQTDRRIVALTFDDGPSPEYIDAILAVLRAEQVHATFFVVGRELDRDPELGAKLVADGHELGNHSYTHVRMVMRSLDFIRGEIDQTDAAIRRAGYRGEIQFRPPYGKRLLALPWVLHQTDRRLTLWDVAPDSADPAITAAAIVARIRAETRPGSIVLLHLMTRDHASSRAALPEVIHTLRGMGYSFVTLSELLAAGPH